MNKNNHQIFTVLFGGAAGDGIREAGMNFGRLLTVLGYSVVVTHDYPSLIRGGHNFTRVTFSNEIVTSDYRQIDILVAFNEETIVVHQKELETDGLCFFDQALTKIQADKAKIALPISEAMKKIGASPIMRSSVVLGALCNYFSIDLIELNKIMVEIFKDKASDLNIELARIGYETAEIIKHRPHRLPISNLKHASLLSGNQAVAEGMAAAGLKFYIAYPMTPASSIQEYLAKNKSKLQTKVIQPENEIAAINMAIGSAYAGARSAVGTSGGGFALMQEAFSLAGINETPLLVVESQRPGPATGVPTGTTQGDLHFMRHAGHGEFPRLVLAPGDVEETYLLAGLALNLAWKYQIPAVVLLDKHLSESCATVNLASDQVREESPKLWDGQGLYQRYTITKDGVSPLAYPGTANAIVKATSYEHDEMGIASEEPAEIKAMMDKRYAKAVGLMKEAIPFVKVYGDAKSETAIIFWGSTKGAVLEAFKYLKRPCRLIQVLSIEPFSVTAFETAVKGVKNFISAEVNYNGQLAQLIREKTGQKIDKQILRYDSKPFDPLELANEINKKI